ncbi:glycoside hydrolase family 3 protein [Caulobacter segnis]
MPYGQDALIEVARANPNTVVVLNTGAPVLMPWIDRVKAVLQMWYPGQRGGEATADLLTGKANPPAACRSPCRSATARPPSPSLNASPASTGRQVYSEGVLVGYRWYDAQGARPLFPFGHGLSYTRVRVWRPEGDARGRRSGRGLHLAQRCGRRTAPRWLRSMSTVRRRGPRA